MEPEIIQQIFKQLTLAKRVLIALPESLTADALSSGLALKLFLHKMGKEAEILSSGEIPGNLAFLPGASEVKKEIKKSNSLALVLDTSANKLEELSYQVHDREVHIFLKSREKSFTPEDITFASEKLPVDAIVILDANSLEALGTLFERNTSLFYETPKIVIDNKAGNEYFGSINLIDLSSSSVAEILAALFEKYERQLVDQDIATCLLAGIIAKTNSFQHSQTTPQSFLKASQLIMLGGRQQEIVKNIFKTKPLPMLKLWGRALARIKHNQELSLIYSEISRADMEKSAAKPEDLPQVLVELANTAPAAKTVALLVESLPGATRVLLASHIADFAKQLSGRFAAKGQIAISHLQGFEIVEFELAHIGLPEAEAGLLEAVKKP